MTTVSRKGRPRPAAAPRKAETRPAPSRAPAAPHRPPPLAGAVIPADVTAYLGKDLRVTPGEKKLLDQGDLRGFWTSRLGKDPVARVGLSMWGSTEDLRAAIQREGTQLWTPDVNLLGALGLLVRDDLPPQFPLHPHTPAQLLRYWTWTGEVTRQRLVDQAVKAGTLPAGAPPAAREALTRRIGQDLANAHSVAVTDDLRHARGNVPGLLSLADIAAYHHRVFAQHGLPPETYGGTPYKAFPNWLELRVAGGLYAPDADEG